MVIAKALDDWRKRRMEAAVEKAVEAAVEKAVEAAVEEAVGAAREEGKFQERQAWESWYARWKEAEAQGEDFSEPPPNGKL